MPGYARHEIKARVLLRLRKGEPMTTEQRIYKRQDFKTKVNT